jgi:hypothetical protein
VLPTLSWHIAEIFLQTLGLALTCKRAFTVVASLVWWPHCWAYSAGLPALPPEVAAFGTASEEPRLRLKPHDVPIANVDTLKK